MIRWYWFANLAAKIVAAMIWRHAPVTAAVLFVAPDLVWLLGLFVPGAQLLGREVTSFAPNPGAREIWLTIDDGPDAEDTPRLLDLLDRHQAKATFFVIGERASRHPLLLAEIVRRGHELGNHTDTHPSGTFWIDGAAAIRRELDRPLALFAQVGAVARVFRPPVGIKNARLATLLTERGLTCVGWTVRSGDCFARSPEEPLRRVLGALRPGAIVLAHEGPSVPAALRVRFLADLLEALAARGYSCVIPEPARWLPAAERRAGPPST